MGVIKKEYICDSSSYIHLEVFLVSLVCIKVYDKQSSLKYLKKHNVLSPIVFHILGS